MSTPTRHWTTSSTLWGMLATAAASAAVTIAGHRWPEWVPPALTEAAEGAAITALGALCLRFRTLSLRRPGRQADAQ